MAEIIWQKVTSETQRLKLEQEAARKIYGENIDRVSTILDSWNDDPDENLYDWAASKGYSWREARDHAARIGTHTHQLIEDWLTLYARGEIVFSDWTGAVISFKKLTASFSRVPAELQPIVMTCFRGFCEWFARFPSVKVIAIEERIINPELGLGGTCDFKCVLDWGEGPKRVMIDWKTSNKTYMKHQVQLGAYSLLHKWKHPNDPPFDFYGVVRFDKKMGGFEEHYTDHDGILKSERFFLHLLEGVRMRKELVMF